MLSRVAIAVGATLIFASKATLACKGPTQIFADNFQTQEPAWYGTLTIGGGLATLPASPRQHNLAFYGGKSIDSGDACVDVTGPSGLQDPTKVRVGIMFGFTDFANYYAFVIDEGGRAAVIGAHNGGSLVPVTSRPAASIKTGPGIANTLRVTWKGNAVSTFINDQPFVTFPLHYGLNNSFIGLYGGNDEPATTTFQFSNLKVTNGP